MTQAAFLPLPRAEQYRDQHHQGDRDDQARYHHQPQLSRRTNVARLQLGGNGREFAVQHRQDVAAGAQRRVDSKLQFAAAFVESGAGGLVVQIGYPVVRNHRIQHHQFFCPAVQQQRCVLAGKRRARRERRVLVGVGGETVAGEGKPAGRRRRGHLVQRRFEFGGRGPQVIQGFLDVAARTQAVMHGFERGADDGWMTLLFTQQLERRRTLCDFARKFESRYEHDGDEAHAKNDDQDEQAGRCQERTHDLG